MDQETTKDGMGMFQRVDLVLNCYMFKFTLSSKIKGPKFLKMRFGIYSFPKKLP